MTFSSEVRLWNLPAQKWFLFCRFPSAVFVCDVWVSFERKNSCVVFLSPFRLWTCFLKKWFWFQIFLGRGDGPVWIVLKKKVRRGVVPVPCPLQLSERRVRSARQSSPQCAARALRPENIRQLSAWIFVW